MSRIRRRNNGGLGEEGEDHWGAIREGGEEYILLINKKGRLEGIVVVFGLPASFVAAIMATYPHQLGLSQF